MGPQFCSPANQPKLPPTQFLDSSQQEVGAMMDQMDNQPSARKSSAIYKVQIYRYWNTYVKTRHCSTVASASVLYIYIFTTSVIRRQNSQAQSNIVCNIVYLSYKASHTMCTNKIINFATLPSLFIPKCDARICCRVSFFIQHGGQHRDLTGPSNQRLVPSTADIKPSPHCLNLRSENPPYQPNAQFHSPVNVQFCIIILQ